VRGGWVDSVKNFKYLGSHITADTTDRKNINERVTQASKAYGALAKQVYSSKKFSHRVKKQLYETFIIPILLYGCGAWAITERDFDRFEPGICQKCGTWHRSNSGW